MKKFFFVLLGFSESFQKDMEAKTFSAQAEETTKIMNVLGIKDFPSIVQHTEVLGCNDNNTLVFSFPNYECLNAVSNSVFSFRKIKIRSEETIYEIFDFNNKSKRERFAIINHLDEPQ